MKKILLILFFCFLANSAFAAGSDSSSETIVSDPFKEAKKLIKRAGKLIDQVTLKPGDLLYIPRGQYHDALASKNGAIHVAFGLTYFKPIDLMASIWEKFILNQFMRNDIGPNLNKESQKSILNKLSREIGDIINTDETLDFLDTQIKNWPYKIKEYSIEWYHTLKKSKNINPLVNLLLNQIVSKCL